MCSPYVTAYIAGLALLLAGCGGGEDEVVVYEAPRDEAQDRQAADEPDADGQEVPENMPPISPGVPSTPVATPAGGVAAPPAMPVLPGMAEEAAKYGTPEWNPPADWTATDLGAMRKGSWIVEDEQGDPIASISVIPGNFGSVDANVARWARQVNLPPNAAETEPLELPDAEGVLIRIIPEAEGRAILGAILQQPQVDWYFKLSGSAEAVRQEAENFRDFLESVRLPE